VWPVSRDGDADLGLWGVARAEPSDTGCESKEARMEEMDEIVQEFLVECYENLDQLDRDLVQLESETGSRDLLASVFRTIHTIKGTSGFLGFDRLESVTHVGENLLARLRDGHMEMTQPVA